MTLLTHCEKNGTGYTLRPETETRIARLTLDGQYLALRCFQEFDPNAEIDEDWLKIRDGGEQVDDETPGECDQEQEEDIIDHATMGWGGLFRR